MTLDTQKLRPLFAEWARVMQENKPMLTELQICYSVNGRYKECSKHIVSNCPSSFMIKGSY